MAHPTPEVTTESDNIENLLENNNYVLMIEIEKNTAIIRYLYDNLPPGIKDENLEIGLRLRGCASKTGVETDQSTSALFVGFDNDDQLNDFIDLLKGINDLPLSHDALGRIVGFCKVRFSGEKEDDFRTVAFLEKTFSPNSSYTGDFSGHSLATRLDGCLKRPNNKKTSVEELAIKKGKKEFLKETIIKGIGNILLNTTAYYVGVIVALAIVGVLSSFTCGFAFLAVFTTAVLYQTIYSIGKSDANEVIINKPQQTESGSTRDMREGLKIKPDCARKPEVKKDIAPIEAQPLASEKAAVSDPTAPVPVGAADPAASAPSDVPAAGALVF